MDILDLRGAVLFICAFLNFLLALSLWLRREERKDILYLSITALFSGLYAVFCGGVYFFWTPGSFASTLWYRLTWLGVLMVPPFVLFTYYFTNRIKKIKLKALFLFLGAGLIGYFALTTTLFLESVHFKYPTISGIAGPLDFFGRLYIFIGIVIGLVNLLREYFKSAGFKRLQIKYLVAGVVVYALAGMIFTAIIPLLTGESAYYDLLAYFSLIWMFLTTYAITRYRLMDIRFVISRGVVFILSLVTIIILVLFIVFLANKFFGIPSLL